MDETGPSPGYKQSSIIGGNKGSIVGGGAVGRGDLVLVLQRVCVPSVDRVVFEAGEDGVGEGQEEHLL